MNLSLGFSSCPNDTFIFDALLHGKISTANLQFTPTIADVEQLNKAAFAGIPDVTKLSFHAYAYVADQYQILDAGSALGFNNGPLVIAPNHLNANEIPSARIAIPGKYTTANLLFSIAFPLAKNKKEVLFSDIEKELLSGECDAGLIIHETRFTFQQHGFIELVDLGQYWQTRFNSPIPLGAIVVKRSLPHLIKMEIANAVAQSVQYAFNYPDSSKDFISQHAQELEESVVRQHINLYVNNYTKSLGNEGRAAIELLYREAAQIGVIQPVRTDIFL